MKYFILTSIAITALLSIGCGSSEDSCCDSGKSLNEPVLIPQVQNQTIKEVVATSSPELEVTAVSTPIPVINFNDGKPIITGEAYTFDCNSSQPSEIENNSSEIVQCDWEIHSFDSDGDPYIDCSIQNTTSHTVHICEVATKIITTLTITDSNGKSSSVTQEYNITK